MDLPVAAVAGADAACAVLVNWGVDVLQRVVSHQYFLPHDILTTIVNKN